MSYFRTCCENWCFLVMCYSAPLCIFALIIGGFLFHPSKPQPAQKNDITDTPQSQRLSSCEPIGQPDCKRFPKAHNSYGSRWKDFTTNVDLLFDRMSNLSRILNEAENNITGEKIQLKNTSNYAYTLADTLFEKPPEISLNFSKINGDLSDRSLELILHLNSGLQFNVDITSLQDTSRVINVAFISRNITFSLTKNAYCDPNEPFTGPVYESFHYDISIKSDDQSNEEPAIENLRTEFKKRVKLMISERISGIQQRLLNFSREEYLQVKCNVMNLIPSLNRPIYLDHFSEIIVDSIKWKMVKVDVVKWPQLSSMKINYLENGTIKLYLKMINSAINVTSNSTVGNNLTISSSDAFDVSNIFVTSTRNQTVTEKAEIRFEGFTPRNSKQSVDQIKKLQKALEKSLESCLEHTGICFKKLR